MVISFLKKLVLSVFKDILLDAFSFVALIIFVLLILFLPFPKWLSVIVAFIFLILTHKIYSYFYDKSGKKKSK